MNTNKVTAAHEQVVRVPNGWVMLVLLIALILTAIPGFSAPAKPDYSAFSIIPDRNIFNTKRMPGVIRTNSSPTNPRPRTTESLVQ